MPTTHTPEQAAVEPAHHVDNRSYQDAEKPLTLRQHVALAARNEDEPPYLVERSRREPDLDDVTIQRALDILTDRLRKPMDVTFAAPADVKHYLVLRLAEEEREVFSVLFIDAQHRLLATEDLFHGTLTQTSVYPREVVKRALYHNAAAVILAHNHPSGSIEPSRADEFLTTTLKSALALVDVRVLDHIVVGGTQTCSFAERGLI